MWDLIVSVSDHCLSFYFTKCLHGGQLVPKSFRTQFGHFVPTSDGWIDGSIHFDHFVPRSNGYEMTVWLMYICLCTLCIF